MLALSLKQPWATLLAHGLKTIEIRRWRTDHRGHILIHASRVPDPRPEAWKNVPRELMPTARLLGGLLGAGDLTDCLVYRTPEQFAADQAHHLNEPSWFEQPLLYGFRFTNLQVLPFQRYPGWMRFFRVEESFSRPAQRKGESPV